MVPVFDIFGGRFGEKDVVWLGAAEGLAGARDSMLQFAAKSPARILFLIQIAEPS